MANMIPSQQTFYVADSSAKHETKPARACNACYESVFPIVDVDNPTNPGGPQYIGSEGRNGDTITSLSGLPSWLSMPALPVQRQPHALMTLSIKPGRDSSLDIDNINDIVATRDERERRARLRVRSHQRLRSYRQIVQDFKVQPELSKQENAHLNDAKGKGTTELNEPFYDKNECEHEDEDADDPDQSGLWHTPTNSVLSSPASSPRKQRREDTARRSKRFSLPAVALHATSVTARTSDIPDSAISCESSGEHASGVGLSKRFSLVLEGRNSYHADGTSKQSLGMENSEAAVPRSVAAARLSELLGRKTKV